MQPMHLTDLIDRDVLQKIQDSFAAATRLHVLTRDASGAPVTEPSLPAWLCTLLSCEKLRSLCGEPIDAAAAKAWTPSPGRPFAVVRFTEPIQRDGERLGVLEMEGLLAHGHPPQECVADLAGQLGVEPGELHAAVPDIVVAGMEQVDRAADLLRSIAEVLSALCERAYDSCRRLREISALWEASKLVSQTRDPQERLDILTRITAEVLGVKGCLIRLLDEANGELVVKSVYNLSEDYLQKGPVNLSDSAVDQEAILGGVVYVPDVTQDPRTLYPRESAEEGLCSTLCAALRTKGRAIGTIRVYTAEPHAFTEDEQALFQTIANHAATNIENATLYEQSFKARALEHELAAAAQIQRHLTPATNPTLPGFDIASRYIPFGIVGGDLYDFVPIQNRHLGIVIADVAGKGIPGAIVMAAARAVVRGSIETVYAARDIVANANRILCRDIGEGQFVTLFYGALDTANRRLTYCNAGHTPPLLFRGGQHCELIEGGIVLGIKPKAAYEERQFVLQKGDILLFYTDGLTETVDPEHEMFGRTRLIETVLRHVGGTAAQILDHVWHAARDFARGEPLHDDFTIIVLKVN